jgi:hypothetical protein
VPSSQSDGVPLGSEKQDASNATIICDTSGQDLPIASDHTCWTWIAGRVVTASLCRPHHSQAEAVVARRLEIARCWNPTLSAACGTSWRSP